MLTYESLIKTTERVAANRIRGVLAESQVSYDDTVAALQWACDRGNVDTFDRLAPHLTIEQVLEGGAYFCAFNLACINGRVSIIERMPAHLKAQAVTIFDGYALHEAISGDYEAVVGHLLDYLPVEFVRSNYNDLMCRLCEKGWLWAVRRLIAPAPEGFGLTADDARACYALRSACRCGRLAVVELLITPAPAGLGLTVDDMRRSCAMRAALLTGRVDVVDRLLAAGLTAEDMREDAARVMEIACDEGWQTVIDYLLDHFDAGRLTAADLVEHREPLFIVCQAGNRPAAERILKSGLTCRNMGRLMKDACDFGYGPIAALLLAHGMEPKPAAIAALVGVSARWRTATSNVVATAQQVGDVLAKWDGRPEFEAAVDTFRLGYGADIVDRWDELRASAERTRPSD